MANSVDPQLLEFGRVLEDSLAEIYIFDAASLQFVLVNRGARENLGYSMDELEALTPLELKPEFTPETFAELIRPLQDGVQQVVEFETIHRRKDTSRYPVRVKLHLSHFNERPVFVATILDLTDSQLAKSQADAAELRFRSYFNLGLIGTAVTSPTKGWLEVNDKLCEIFGYTRDELTSKTWAELTHPDDLDADLAQFNDVLAGKIDGYSMEKRFIRKDGRVIDTTLNVHCLRNEDGSVDQFVALIQDIRDRKRAEQELRQAHSELELRVENRTQALKESQDRFEAFMDNSPAAAWLKDEQGRYVYFSKTYEQRFGVELKDWHNKTDFDFWSQEMAEEFRKNDLAVLTSGKVLEVVERATDSDGIPRYHLNFKFPFTDANGSQYVGGIGVDVTDRRRAEEALRQSEERFRLVTNATNDAIYDCDLVNGTVWWNEQLIRLFGERSEEQDTTWDWWKDRIHPDDRARVADGIEAAIDGRANAGDIWTDEYRFQRTDGSYAFINDRAYITRDANGNATRLLGAMQNVTEQKLSEDSLRRSEERFRLAALAINEAIWEVDPKSGTVWWNDTYDTLFGPRPPKSSKSWEWWEDHVHPEDRERVTNSLMALLRGSADLGDIWVEEYRYRRASGDYAIVVDRGFVARDAEGNPTRVVGAMQDITKIKRAEAELRDEQQLLRQLIDLQESERRMVAHDIHDGFVQDVVGAHMRVQCIESTMDPDTNESTATSVALLLERAIAEGRRLIREMRPMVLDELGIVEAIRHLLADEKKQAGLAVAFDHDVQFDRLEARLEGIVYRIVQEALSNVRRHSQRDDAAVRLTQRDGELEIIVRDQGIGFDPKAGGRKGFGLRGIHERARLSGGKARIESAPGNGTVVRVTIPIQQDI